MQLSVETSKSRRNALLFEGNFDNPKTLMKSKDTQPAECLSISAVYWTQSSPTCFSEWEMAKWKKPSWSSLKTYWDAVLDDRLKVIGFGGIVRNLTGDVLTSFYSNETYTNNPTSAKAQALEKPCCSALIWASIRLLFKKIVRKFPQNKLWGRLPR